MKMLEQVLRKFLKAASPRDKQITGIAILVEGYWVECVMEKGAKERWLYEGVDFRRILNLSAVQTSYQDGTTDLYSLDNDFAFTC